MLDLILFYEDAFYKFEHGCKLIQQLNESFPKFFKPYADNMISELNQLSNRADFPSKEFEFLQFATREIDFTWKRQKEYHLPPHVRKLWDEWSDKSNFIYGSETFLREMSLVYLITLFEDFLYDILQLYYLRTPSRVQSRLTQIEESRANGNTDKIEGMRINKQIDGIFSQNVEVLNANLLREFQLDFKTQADWDKFLECFEHRHIIIHKDGSPDDRYQSRTSYSGHMGSRVPTDEAYIVNSLIIFQNFAKIVRDHFLKNYAIS